MNRNQSIPNTMPGGPTQKVGGAAPGITTRATENKKRLSGAGKNPPKKVQFEEGGIRLNKKIGGISFTLGAI